MEVVEATELINGLGITRGMRMLRATMGTVGEDETARSRRGVNADRAEVAKWNATEAGSSFDEPYLRHRPISSQSPHSNLTRSQEDDVVRLGGDQRIDGYNQDREPMLRARNDATLKPT